MLKSDGEDGSVGVCEPGQGERGGVMMRALLGGVVVLLCSVVVFWLFLDLAPFSKTEGHRALPGWEIVESGEWLPTRMYGTVYMTKPPGMMWAVAVVSMVLGESEFSARAVSAGSMTLLALVAYVFGVRWFGVRAGIASGLGILMILTYWSSGRSADIEGLLCLMTGLMGFALVDLHAMRRGWVAGGVGMRVLMVALVAVGFAGAVLAKGPAVLMVLAGVMVAPAVLERSWRGLGNGWGWLGVGIGAAVVGGIGWKLWGALEDESVVVSQSPKAFLWDVADLVHIGLFVPGALVLGVPLVLVLVYPWGRDALREGEADAAWERKLRIARVLALACVLSLVVGMLTGLANPRYGKPSLLLAAPVASYVLAGYWGGFMAHRRRIARWMMLGHPAVWVVLMLVGSVVWARFVRPEGRDGGFIGGQMLGEAIVSGGGAEPVRVWGDGAVFAKPEVFWYAERAAEAEGVEVSVRWAREELRGGEVGASGTYLVLTKRESGEMEGDARLERVMQLREGADGFVVWRVR